MDNKLLITSYKNEKDPEKRKNLLEKLNNLDDFDLIMELSGLLEDEKDMGTKLLGKVIIKKLKKGLSFDHSITPELIENNLEPEKKEIKQTNQLLIIDRPATPLEIILEGLKLSIDAFPLLQIFFMLLNFFFIYSLFNITNYMADDSSLNIILQIFYIIVSILFTITFQFYIISGITICCEKHRKEILCTSVEILLESLTYISDLMAVSIMTSIHIILFLLIPAFTSLILLHYFQNTGIILALILITGTLFFKFLSLIETPIFLIIDGLIPYESIEASRNNFSENSNLYLSSILPVISISIIFIIILFMISESIILCTFLSSIFYNLVICIIYRFHKTCFPHK